jgi:hypothetical protein
MYRLGYKEELWYEYVNGLSFVNDQYDLSRPSYNIKLYYSFELICEVAYELDVRFSLEVREEEIHRIETLLADRLTGVITSNGVISLMAYKQKKGQIPCSVVKESDDKNFLSLN